MFAVIETGGKQYRVAEGDVVKVDRLAVEAGSKISIDQVLMLGGADEASLKIGAPLVAGAAVEAEVVAQDRTRKIIVFKKRRRKHYRRSNTHRQEFTVLRITAIKAA